MENSIDLGIIGGSGLYGMEALEHSQELTVSTPFGPPSSPVIVGRLSGQPVAFLARHGLGHTLSPTEVNYRANIHALKSLGVRWLVSVSACGSLRDDYAPGQIVVPDQLIDFTRDRKRSFFDSGIVAHVSVADPFCADLSAVVYASLQEVGASAHSGGTSITIEGPRFSTRAESNVFRAWGMSLIGMTTAPEAFLAREAEMCYAVMAHVTDYDVWHVTEEPVSVEQVVRISRQNTAIAQWAIQALVHRLAALPACPHQDALSKTIATAPEAMSPETRARLDLLLKKYLD
ncbi:MAG: S-methyl-5'-thioadenosine phosphorylase [Anaerolineae bacterium]|nr:MAG: S-methyl-5'-thioadenosine phosphorylase [Anaerolineae bacterium]